MTDDFLGAQGKSDPVCMVHIGAPKTGSTALQRYCSEHRAKLLRRRLLYFATGLRGFGHHDVAFLLGGGYPEWATPQERPLSYFVEGFRKEAEGHNGDILISSEDFYLYPNPAGLYDFLESCGASSGRTVKILVYVRRQDELHESWYNQTIKAQGCSHTVEECVKRYHSRWNYADSLRPWAEVFGPEAIIVKPYESTPLHPVDTVSTTLEMFGIDLATLPPQQGWVNTNINRDILEFQRIINQLQGGAEQKRALHKQLIALSNETKGKGVFVELPSLSPKRRRELLNDYADSNREVAQTYVGRGKLFADMSIDETEKAGNYSGLTVERYLRIIQYLAQCTD